MLEFRQSRSRGLLNRLYRATWDSIVLLAGAFLGSALGAPGQLILPVVGLYFTIALLLSVWLFIFNRSPELPGLVVRLTHEGLTIVRYGEPVGHLTWPELENYSVTNHPLRKVEIVGRGGAEFRIDYYSLSRADREQLISQLDQRVRASIMRAT